MHVGMRQLAKIGRRRLEVHFDVLRDPRAQVLEYDEDCAPRKKLRVAAQRP